MRIKFYNFVPNSITHPKRGLQREPGENPGQYPLL